MAMVPPIKGSTGAFELCPPGPQQLVCCDVVDHGIVKTSFGGKERAQHKISLRWQSKYRMRTGKPYLIQKRYTFSLHPKASLRKDVDAWRGVALTDEQAMIFDLERLLGINCFANVAHIKKPRGIFAEVMSLMPLPRDMEKIQVESYTRVAERKPGEVHDDAPPAAEQGEAAEPDGPVDTSFTPPANEPEF